MKKSIYKTPEISIIVLENKSDILLVSTGIMQSDDDITPKYAANSLGFSGYSSN